MKICWNIYKLKLARPISFFFLAIAVSGCSTSFKYTPTNGKIYTPIAGQTGLAIQTGQDLRPMDERRPGWARNAESIVAHALAEEVRDANLFHRVKIHAEKVNNKKYSEIVTFQVKKFECYNKPAFLEETGRDLLRFQGIRGALIAESIPSRYTSEVEVEFKVLDAATQQVVFTKNYSATQTETINGYQGAKPKVQQTSDVLSKVLSQFVADLAKISAGQ
jgi:hypothetical protein